MQNLPENKGGFRVFDFNEERTKRRITDPKKIDLSAPWARGVSPNSIQIIGDLAARSEIRPIPARYVDPPAVSHLRWKIGAGLVLAGAFLLAAAHGTSRI